MEFERWAPSVKVISYIGNPQTRYAYFALHIKYILNIIIKYSLFELHDFKWKV